MKKPTLPILLALSFCLPAFAEERVDHRLKSDREKESRRCMESARWHSNAQEFEKKFGWAKEHFEGQYNELRAKRNAASNAWKTAAERIGQARSRDEISAIKIPAYQAGAVAHLAELELKADSAEKRWLEAAKKYDTEESRKASRALIDNQRKHIEITKAKLISEHQIRELAWQKAQLSQIMEEEYRKSRQNEEDKRRNGGRTPSKTNGVPLKKVQNDRPAAQPAKPTQPKIRIE